MIFWSPTCSEWLGGGGSAGWAWDLDRVRWRVAGRSCRWAPCTRPSSSLCWKRGSAWAPGPAQPRGHMRLIPVMWCGGGVPNICHHSPRWI
jgi:hypothetical protein